MQSIFRGLPSAPSQQRGMATILIIMLMGLALTVTALGVMYSVRTSQEQQVHTNYKMPQTMCSAIAVVFK
jgi:ABC-type lipoprotein release transport system permease subunit